MYTGYFLVDNEMHGPDGPTGLRIHDHKIVTLFERSSDYYLVEGLIDSIKHIYGPEGFTHFYLQGRHIYGPNKELPWVCIDHRSQRT